MYLDEIKNFYDGNQRAADLLHNCIDDAMVGMRSTTQGFNDLHKIVDVKVALLIAEKYGTNNGSNAIDPNTYQVNVGGKVMLLKEMFGSPKDSFSSNFIGRSYFTFLLPRRYGRIMQMVTHSSI